MPRWVRTLVALVLVAAAWGVYEAAPLSTDVQAPFPVRGDAGERITGRNISAVVVPDGSTARAAERVRYAMGDHTLRTNGVFLVVPVSVQEVVGRYGTGYGSTSLSHAQLVVDGTRYGALTGRLDVDDPSYRGLSVGIDLVMDLVFEVPSAVLRRSDPVEVELGLLRDASFDSVVRARLSLDGVERVKHTDVAQPTRRVP